MSHNDYSFQSYLAESAQSWFGPDAFLHSVLDSFVGPSWRERERELSAVGRILASELATLADRAALPENLPRLIHHDAYERRVDEIHIDAGSETIRRAFYRDRPYCAPSWLLYTKIFLFAQLGEAGTVCSAVCTDGMVRLLRALGDGPNLKAILSELEDGAHAAQFITEIQGGSDVGANLVTATQDGESYRISGTKWFCSNIIADHFVVTARPEGAPAGVRGVSLFAVPAYLGGKRNGYDILRLKDKLGTQNLPTAEVELHGALGYPIGPLNRGVANLMRHVISRSRFGCAVGAAGFLYRVARDVRSYARFRSAFGQSILQYPEVGGEVSRISEAALSMLCGNMALLRLWNKADANPNDELQKRLVRILLMLNKSVTTRQASLWIHRALSVFGGNGVEQQFTVGPRLLRDAIVNEIWEGPHGLMLSRSLAELAANPDRDRMVEITSLPERREELKRGLASVLEKEGDERAVLFSDWATKWIESHQALARQEVMCPLTA